MKKLLLLLLLLFFVVAIVTKPDDKTCIIGGVRAVWGNLTPNPNDKPDMFEIFMNLHSSEVKVQDWLIFKQVKYTVQGGQKTVALGAFKKLYPLVRPVEFKTDIPKMPTR